MPEKESHVPITVVHVAERYSGGVATFVKMLAQTQSKDPRFATVHVLADLRFSPVPENTPGVKIHQYKSSRNPLQLLAVAIRVNKILRDIQPDVVLAHSSFPGAYTRIIKQQWPIVYCAHGWSFAQSASKIKSFAYGLAERLLAFRTAAIVNVSTFEQQEALKVGIPKKIQHTILNGLPDKNLESRPRFVANQSQINLGFIGRIDPKKGVDRLLRIFRDHRLNNMKLWVIGGRADELNATSISGNIEFVGWIPNAEIDSHIRQLDAIIVPSRWEAFSLVALEAMRAERAVIAGRIGGLQELVSENETGIFVDMDDPDHMYLALSSLTKARLRCLGKNGRKKFEEKFTWRQCYDSWADLIARVSSGSRQKKPTL